jgi:hypothetical protein
VVEAFEPGELTPYLEAHTLRLRAGLDAAREQRDGIDDRFRHASRLFREFDLVFDLAVSQLEHAEWLEAQGQVEEAQPLLDEARETFERLQATPWLQRSGRGERVAQSV